MIVGAYDLHLYCDDPRHDYSTGVMKPGEFTGNTLAEAVREARRAGWVVNLRAKTAVCPRHSGKPPRAPASGGRSVRIQDL